MTFLSGLRRALAGHQPPSAPPPVPTGADESKTVQLEHAWRTYEAIQDWIKRTETKATFLVTIESALLVYFMTMVGSSGIFDDFKNLPIWFAALMASSGVVVLFLAVITVVRVIAPRVSEIDLAAQYAERDLSTIAESLRRDDPLVGLSHQLRVTSETALKKDLFLAKSVAWALYGFGLVILATLLVAVVDHFHLDFRIPNSR